MKYLCKKCGWVQEQNDNYPKNIFICAIEVHNNNFCKKNMEKCCKKMKIILRKIENDKLGDFEYVCANCSAVHGIVGI